MCIEEIKNSIRDIPDFPKKGILFKDITTALNKPDILHKMIEIVADRYKDMSIDYVAGIEARGFIFGATLAYELGCGFVPIRKAGKLPAEVLTEDYNLEYGTDKIEMHKDAVVAGARVLIVDDLLATGGTAEAAARLILKAKAEVAEFAFMIELQDLLGRKNLEKYAKVFSLVSYL